MPELTIAVPRGALFGETLDRLDWLGVDTSQVSPVELVLQITLAGFGLGAVAATADRRPRPDGSGKASRPQ